MVLGLISFGEVFDTFCLLLWYEHGFGEMPRAILTLFCVIWASATLHRLFVLYPSHEFNLSKLFRPHNLFY